MKKKKKKRRKLHDFQFIQRVHPDSLYFAFPSSLLSLACVRIFCLF